jgi:CRISPR/Cas system-associated exonuclease Cas4 (RecB family)
MTKPKKLGQNSGFKSAPGEFDAQEFSSIIEKAYLADKREDTFKTKKTFSPSSIGYGSGTCPRRWVISFRGAIFEDNMDVQGMANVLNGTSVHERLQGLLKNTDLDYELEKAVVSERPPIKGFADVVIQWKEKGVVGEIKSTRDEAFAYRKVRMTAPAYNLIQVLIYMDVLGLDEGFLWYENKNDLNFVIIPVTWTDKNRKLINNVYDWMNSVYETFEAGDLPTRPFTKRNKECKECPVRNACWNELPEGTVDLPVLVLPK